MVTADSAWDSGTAGKPGSVCRMEGGTLVIYDPDNRKI
jgi:hypothetical protein